MKKIIALLLVILLFTSCSAVESQKKEDVTVKQNKFEQISMEEAKKLLAEGSDYVLLDVRTKEEFAGGHIKNAVNIPNETISASAIPELPNKEQKIYVYCRSGNRSKQAAEKLADLGYTNVTEIGGIIDWSGEIVTQ